VCLFPLAFAYAQPTQHAQSQTTSRVAGRLLIDVLREYQQQGLHLIFSSDLVTSDLRVTSEPRGRSARAILAEILAPHGLTLRDGPRSTLLIVRVSAVHTPVRAAAGNIDRKSVV